ncbi:MAG: NADH-quinone oxidoreductase subunit N [Holophagaceae bacterium]|nr:NADH-quinone oxidoreductase subunit N [Holophagaceae bacterium]
MPFAQALWESLARDSRLVLPVLVLWLAGTLMLWPFDSWLLKRMPKDRWAFISIAVLLLSGWFVIGTPEAVGFSEMFRIDGATKGFQALCIIAGILTIAMGKQQLCALKEHMVEYYALILFSISGMLILVGATDLVSIYFALELMALCVYILVAYLRTQERGIEAGVKYFLLGAFSSGILLFGISLLFAATGGTTTNLERLGQAIALAPGNHELLVFCGVLMVLVGFAFKVAAVPFHMWSPDAYEGAPTPITAFMSMAPKAAALAAFLRIFGTGFHGVMENWVAPLSFIAAASMILGNVAALRQQSIKRMLAYSSIGHVGYMLLGVLSTDTQAGAQAVWLYMAVYLVMQTGAFAVVIYQQGAQEGERIDDFRGLGKKRPILAFAMMVFMLSLAGIPPLLGFFSKFYLFRLAIIQGHVALTVIALLTSAVAAYFYLNVIAQMYFKDPADKEVTPFGLSTAVLVTACSTVLLIGTAFGPWIMEWVEKIGWG